MRECVFLGIIMVVLFVVIASINDAKRTKCENYGGVLIGGGAYSKPTCVNPDGTIVMEYHK